MTAADKLRELLATRPKTGSFNDLLSWWISGAALVEQALDDYALECVQHRTDNEGAASAIATEAHEKSVLEQVEHGLRVKLGEACQIAWRRARNEFPPEDSDRLVELYSDALESILPVDDESLCAVCRWPLAEEARRGCVRGNCSQRPRPVNLYAPERAAKETHELALRNGMPPSGRWA